MAHEDAYAVGDRVDGLYDGNSDDVWYPGVIAAWHDSDGTYDVLYDDGESEQHVVVEYLRVHQRGTICVGTRVFGRYAGGDEWYPGKIQEVLDDGTFTIEYDDGEVEPSVELERIRESMSEGTEEREGAREEADSRADHAPEESVEAAHETEADETVTMDEDVSKEVFPVVDVRDHEESSEPSVMVETEEVEVSHPQDPEKEDTTTSTPPEIEDPIKKSQHVSRSSHAPGQGLKESNEPVRHEPPQDARAVDEYAGILATVQQLETNAIDPIATKTLLSTLVKHMRAYPQATAELVHARRGEEMLIEILKRHHSHAVIQCYGFVLSRRLCFLCGKSTHFFLRNGIVDLVMIAMRKFAEDAILQASACGALAVFTRVYAGLVALLDNRVSHLVLATIIFHKTYSVHTRQVHYYACEVLLELCELGDKTTIEALCGDAISGPVLSDLSPVSLLLFLLRQALSFDDKKACCAVGTLLMCLASCHRHAAQMILDLNGLSELSTVMAKYPTEPGIQKYAASASKEIALCSMEQQHSPTARAHQQRRLHGTAYDLLDESSSMEEHHHRRAIQQRKQVGGRSRTKNGTGTKRKAPATDRYGVNSMNGYPSPTHQQYVGTIAATSRDGLSFSKYASPIGHAPHLPPNIRPSGGPVAPSPSGYQQQQLYAPYGQTPRNHGSPLVILDSQGNALVQDKRRFVKEERQNLLFETYGVDAKTALQHGDGRTQGIKRRQLKTHIISAAANVVPDAKSWASPVKTTMLIKEDKPLSSRSRKLDSKASDSRTVRTSNGGYPSSGRGMYDDIDSDEQSPATLRRLEEQARGSALVKRKSEGESKTPRAASFQLKLDNGSSSAVAMQSPIVATPKRSKNTTGYSRPKVSAKVPRTSKPTARNDNPNMHLDVSKESLNSYAAQLFKEEMEAPIHQSHAAEERERLSFAEKLHKMIDKAKSSLAHSSSVSLAADTEVSESPMKGNRPERSMDNVRKKPGVSASVTSRVAPTSISRHTPVESSSKKSKGVVTARSTPAKASAANPATPPAKAVSTVSPSLYTPAPPKNLKSDSSSHSRAPAKVTATSKTKPTSASRASSTAKAAAGAAQKKPAINPTTTAEALAAEALSQPRLASGGASLGTKEGELESSDVPTKAAEVSTEPVSEAAHVSHGALSNEATASKDKEQTQLAEDSTEPTAQDEPAINTKPQVDIVTETVEDADTLRKADDLPSLDAPVVDDSSPRADKEVPTPDETVVTSEEAVVAAAVAVVSAAHDMYADEYNDFDDDADGGDNAPPTQDDDGVMMMVDTSALLGRDVSFEALMSLTAQVTARQGDSEPSKSDLDGDHAPASTGDGKADGVTSSDAKVPPEEETQASVEGGKSSDEQPPTEENPILDVVDMTQNVVTEDAAVEGDMGADDVPKSAESDSELQVATSLGEATESILTPEVNTTDELPSEDSKREEAEIPSPGETSSRRETALVDNDSTPDSTAPCESSSGDMSSPDESIPVEGELEAPVEIPPVSDRPESQQTDVSYADEDFEDTPNDTEEETPRTAETAAAVEDEPQWSVADLPAAVEVATSHLKSGAHSQGAEVTDDNASSETQPADLTESGPAMEPAHTAHTTHPETSRSVEEYSFSNGDFNDESLPLGPSDGENATEERTDNSPDATTSEDAGVVPGRETELALPDQPGDVADVLPSASEDVNDTGDAVSNEREDEAKAQHELSQSETPSESNELVISDDSPPPEDHSTQESLTLPDRSEETIEQIAQTHQEEAQVVDDASPDDAVKESPEEPAPDLGESTALPEGDGSEIQIDDAVELPLVVPQDISENTSADVDVVSDSDLPQNDSIVIEPKHEDGVAPDEAETLLAVEVNNEERATTPDAYDDGEFDDDEAVTEREFVQPESPDAVEPVEIEIVSNLHCYDVENTTPPNDATPLKLDERPSTPDSYEEDLSFAEDATLLASVNTELSGPEDDAPHSDEATTEQTISDEPTSESPGEEEVVANESVTPDMPTNGEELQENHLADKKPKTDGAPIAVPNEGDTGGVGDGEITEKEQTLESVIPVPVASDEVVEKAEEPGRLEDIISDSTLSDLPLTLDPLSEPSEPAKPPVQAMNTSAPTPDATADPSSADGATSNNLEIPDQPLELPVTEEVDDSSSPPQQELVSVVDVKEAAEADAPTEHSVRARTDTYEDEYEFENDAITSRSIGKLHESEVENNEMPGIEGLSTDEIEPRGIPNISAEPESPTESPQVNDADSPDTPPLELALNDVPKAVVDNSEEAAYEDDTVSETVRQDDHEEQAEESQPTVKVEDPQTVNSDVPIEAGEVDAEGLEVFTTEVNDKYNEDEQVDDVEKTQPSVIPSSVPDEMADGSSTYNVEETKPEFEEVTAPSDSVIDDNIQVLDETTDTTNELEVLAHRPDAAGNSDNGFESSEDPKPIDDGREVVVEMEDTNTDSIVPSVTVEDAEALNEARGYEDEGEQEPAVDDPDGSAPVEEVGNTVSPDSYSSECADTAPIEVDVSPAELPDISRAGVEHQGDNSEDEPTDNGDRIEITERENEAERPTDDSEGTSMVSHEELMPVSTEQVESTRSAAEEQAPAEPGLPLEETMTVEPGAVVESSSSEERAGHNDSETGNIEEQAGDQSEPLGAIDSDEVTAVAEMSCETQEPAEALELESEEQRYDETPPLELDEAGQTASVGVAIGQCDSNGTDVESPIEQSTEPVTEDVPNTTEDELAITETTVATHEQPETEAKMSDDAADAGEELTEVFTSEGSGLCDKVGEQSEASHPKDEELHQAEVEAVVGGHAVPEAATEEPALNALGDVATEVTEPGGDASTEAEVEAVGPANGSTTAIRSATQAPQPEDEYAFEDHDQVPPSVAEPGTDTTSTPAVDSSVPAGATPHEFRSDEDVQYDEEENEFEEATPRLIGDVPSVETETKPTAPAEASPSTDEVEFDDFEAEDSPRSDEAAPVESQATEKEEQKQELQVNKAKNEGEETEYAEDNDEYNDFEEEETVKSPDQKQPVPEEVEEAEAYAVEEDGFEDEEEKEKTPPRIEVQSPPTVPAAPEEAEDMDENEYDAEYDEFED